MDSLNDLHIIGLSHRTAPVDVRERYAVKAVDLEDCLRTLVGHSEVDEALVVSTCNRTDVLLVGNGSDPLHAARSSVFRNLDAAHLYSFAGLHALMHLFRVVSGLDSQIVGESEILAQVKRAFDTAQSVGAAGRETQAIYAQVMRVGKRVRNETEIGEGTLSIARVGLDVAKRVFGDFTSCRALVVGAGETGLLTARHLVSEKVGRLMFANRTLATAEAAAAEMGGEAYGLDRLGEALAASDLVLVCVEASEAVVKSDHFQKRALSKRDRPQLVIDLSVPRAVDPAVGEFDNLLLYDLDDLQPVIDENRRSRDIAGDTSGEILVGEMHKFLSLRTYAAFSPVIAALREQFEVIREHVLDDVTAGSATAREIELAHMLTKKQLDAALSQMKQSARHARSEQYLDREYQRFLDKL